FKKAISTGAEFGVPVIKKTVVSHEISEAILDVARSGKSNILLLGGTEKMFRGKIKQSVPQIVMRNADCDVGIFFPKHFKEVRSILVPLGLGEHEFRVMMGQQLAEFFNARMTLLTVIGDDATVPQAQEMQDKATQIVKMAVNCQVVVSDSIEDTIVKQSKDHDLIILGPSTEWLLHDVLFGSLPDRIINRSNCSILIVKQPEHRAESWIELLYDKIRRV
ncbi:MAG: universal stress protein, partial [ANME-2 cluster archaeon]|nr:universal stress protein [ANME-2 cluster archaeon]